jgi:uracil-DNA glycosylase family 4
MMKLLDVKTGSTFEEWRNVARALLGMKISPDEVRWVPGNNSPHDHDSLEAIPIKIPAEFIERARKAFHDSRSDTPALLYRVLFRIAQGEKTLMKAINDRDVQELKARYQLHQAQHQIAIITEHANPDPTYRQFIERALAQIGLHHSTIFFTHAFPERPRIGTPVDETSLTQNRNRLRRELANVRPQKIIGLGETAAELLLGKPVAIRDVRGQTFKTAFSDRTLILPDPVAILRVRDKKAQQYDFRNFVVEMNVILK